MIRKSNVARETHHVIEGEDGLVSELDSSLAYPAVSNAMHHESRTTHRAVGNISCRFAKSKNQGSPRPCHVKSRQVLVTPYLSETQQWTYCVCQGEKAR